MEVVRALLDADPEAFSDVLLRTETALGPVLRGGAELLEIQGQSVAGWHGQCTLRLLRNVAAQRPLRLDFSSGLMASQLSVTELLGTAQVAASGQTESLREAELAEVRRRVLMSRLSLMRVNKLLLEVMLRLHAERR